METGETSKGGVTSEGGIRGRRDKERTKGKRAANREGSVTCIRSRVCVEREYEKQRREKRYYVVMCIQLVWFHLVLLYSQSHPV